MKGINRQMVTATAATTLIFCLGLIAINATHSSWKNRIDQHIRQLASDQALLLENQINRSLAGAKILAVHIHTQGGKDQDFIEVADTIRQNLEGITTLQLEPQGVTSKIHPQRGFEQLLGNNIFQNERHKTEALLAQKSRQLVLSDPFEVADNELAIVGRQPIFLHAPSHYLHPHNSHLNNSSDTAWKLEGEHFWGFASVLIHIKPLLQQTILPTLSKQDYAFRLWRASPNTGEERLIAGQAVLLGTQPSQHSINLPNDTWFLEVAYLGTTLGKGWIITLVSLNICITLLAGHWLYNLFRRQQILEQQVNQRTLDLNSNNLQLQREKLELKKFKNAVNDSGNCIVITDATGVIEYVNHRFTEVTGYSAKEAVGGSPSVLKSPFTRKEEHSELWRTISHGRKWRGERRNVRKDGSYYWSLMSISPIKDASGTITHFVSVSEDITENKELQLQVERLAYHDPLTGLSNRRYFMNQLEHQCRLCERSNELAAVLFMDLDHFKMINDTLGHEFGDELLKLVARKILSCLRDSDIPSRLGGDEFTILLPMLDTETSAKAVADKLVAIINEPFTLSGHNIQQSISIGISIIRGQGLSAKEVLRQADQALYIAKQTGRNQFRVFEEIPTTANPEQASPVKI
ncbi:MAG: diguanylate cyclase [Halopseudomonas sp.]